MNIFYHIACFVWFSRIATMVDAGKFPALVLTKMHLFWWIPPRVSNTGELIFQTFDGESLYILCPPSESSEALLNAQSKTDRFLDIKRVVEKKVSMNEIATFCESEVKAGIFYDDYFDRKPQYYAEKYSLLISYEIGFKIRNPAAGNLGSNSPFCSILNVKLNKLTRETVFIRYGIYLQDEEDLRLRSSTEVIDDAQIEFVNTENKTDLDLKNSYQNFENEEWPNMENEKSQNEKAHSTGINKMRLIPEGDFSLDTWKVVTHFDVVTAPVWKAVIPTWKKAEIFIRRLLIVIRKLSFFVGASGKSRFSKHLRIPKYLWRFVKFPNSDAMLIIMHNDPFDENQDRICDDICADNGWDIVNDDYQTGLLYCCNLTSEIAKKLEIPLVYTYMNTPAQVELRPFDLNKNHPYLPDNLLKRMLLEEVY